MKFVRKVVVLVLFGPVLIILPCLFVVQFVLASPFLLFAVLFLPKRPGQAGDGGPIKVTGYRPKTLTFNRLNDISKLHGCNTRNVRYRWDFFSAALAGVKRDAEGASLQAIDFGAGSLRDSYELSRLGFRVLSIDLNLAAMQEGFHYYQWSEIGGPPVLANDLEVLKQYQGKCSVIISFDVIEHLHAPEKIMAQLKACLLPGGVFLVTVPNRLTWWERIFRRGHERRMKAGIVDHTGVPHVQFRTPEEWSGFFQSQGWRVKRHEMAIGFLVNDVWHAFYGIPARTFVEPVLLRLSGWLKLGYTPGRFEKLFYPAWLMGIVDRLDVLAKPAFARRWAWNLFVLENS